MTERLNHRITRLVKEKANYPGFMKGEVSDIDFHGIVHILKMIFVINVSGQFSPPFHFFLCGIVDIPNTFFLHSF